MRISDRVKEFYSRTDEGYTRKEMGTVFTDVNIVTLGNTMQNLYRDGYLDREPVKHSKYQAMRYYRIGAKPVHYQFVKPAESLV